ncbi:LrgB-like family-domain-containing protein [Chytriomyces sp. MP71]|nr:LrgB-like family-domain-containing protein [Chytriomyces sp. MP71]
MIDPSQASTMGTVGDFLITNDGAKRIDRIDGHPSSVEIQLSVEVEDEADLTAHGSRHEDAVSLVRAMIGMMVFQLISDACDKLFAKIRVSLPGCVVGAALVFILLCLASLVSPSLVSRAEWLLLPAADLLLSWLAMLFVPAMIGFPLLVPRVPPLDLIKLMAILIIAAPITLACTALLLMGSHTLRDKLCQLVGRRSDRMNSPSSQHRARVPPQPMRATIPFPIWFMVMAFGIVMVCLCAQPFLLESHNIRVVMSNVGFVAALPTSFSLLRLLQSESRIRSHPNWQWAADLLNPVATTALVCWLLIELTALAAHIPFSTAISDIHSGASIKGLQFDEASAMRAGDWIQYLLNASVVAMAFPMFSRAHILRGWRAVDAGLSLLAVSAASLFATAGLARAFSIESTLVRRSIVLRTVTTPIAVASVSYVDGDASIASLTAILTGVFTVAVWRLVLRLCRAEDAYVRGLAMGASAHGIGTATLLMEEAEAAPFAPVAFVVVGIASSALLAIPPFQRALLAVIGD